MPETFGNFGKKQEHQVPTNYSLGEEGRQEGEERKTLQKLDVRLLAVPTEKTMDERAMKEASKDLTAQRDETQKKILELKARQPKLEKEKPLVLGNSDRFGWSATLLQKQKEPEQNLAGMETNQQGSVKAPNGKSVSFTYMP